MHPSASSETPALQSAAAPLADADHDAAWWANPYLLILLGATINIAAEMFLKVGADAAASHGRVGLLGFAALGSMWTWLGVAGKIAALLLWLAILRSLPVSIAFALMTAPEYVLVPVGAFVFLHEPISLARWIGIALVLIGALLIMRPMAHAEERL